MAPFPSVPKDQLCSILISAIVVEEFKMAPVVQKVDNAIHWMNLYPVDNTTGSTGSASYPDVSLLMKMCAQRKAGRRQRARLRLPSVPFPWSPAVYYDHQSLVPRSPLPCEKRSAWGGGCHWIVIYPEDSIIQRLNKRALVVMPRDTPRVNGSEEIMAKERLQVNTYIMSKHFIIAVLTNKTKGFI